MLSKISVQHSKKGVLLGKVRASCFLVLRGSIRVYSINCVHKKIIILVREPQFGQSGLHIGVLHKQVPKQSGAVILYHYHDGALVNS